MTFIAAVFASPKKIGSTCSMMSALPTIEQHTKALETEYQKRFDEALDARVAAYTKAFDKLVKTPGWTEIDKDQQRRLPAVAVIGDALPPFRRTWSPTIRATEGSETYTDAQIRTNNVRARRDAAGRIEHRPW